MMFEKIKDALKDAQDRLERISPKSIHAQDMEDFAWQYLNQFLAERAARLRLGLAISQGKG